jgi:hypothetical protein
VRRHHLLTDTCALIAAAVVIYFKILSLSPTALGFCMIQWWWYLQEFAQVTLPTRRTGYTTGKVATTVYALPVNVIVKFVLQQHHWWLLTSWRWWIVTAYSSVTSSVNSICACALSICRSMVMLYKSYQTALTCCGYRSYLEVWGSTTGKDAARLSRFIWCSAVSIALRHRIWPIGTDHGWEKV